MKKLIATALASLTLAGCASYPAMDETKPVYFSKSLFDVGFKQEGHRVDQGDATAKISRVPEAKEKIRAATAWQLGGMALDIVGLVIAVTTPSTNDYRNFDNGRFYGGLFGGILASAVCNVVANDKLEDAAEIYNGASFNVTPKAQPPKTSMFISPRRDGAVAGVSLNF